MGRNSRKMRNTSSDSEQSDVESNDVAEDLKPVKVSSNEKPNRIFFCYKDDARNLLKHLDNVFIFSYTYSNSDACIHCLDPAVKDQHSKYLYEITTWADSNRSFFVDNTVISNGDACFLTPVDPIFIVLDVLFSNDEKRASPIDQHLEGRIPGLVINSIVNNMPDDQLSFVASKKVSGDIVAWKYDEVAALEWIELKCKRLAEHLKKERVLRYGEAVSSNYVKSSEDLEEIDEKHEKQYLTLSCKAISEYVHPSIMIKLLQKLDITNDNKTSETSIKKAKTETNEFGTTVPLEDYGSDGKFGSVKVNEKGKMTSKQKELKKAANGTKSIMNFFSKKPSTN